MTTNLSQPLQPLAKVASGGELSLTIQAITDREMDTPALIFDEVNVGISGQTVAIVGKMLRQLGESIQVVCVTYLLQVAGFGHHHFFVSKNTDVSATQTQMQALDKKLVSRTLRACEAAAKSLKTRWRKPESDSWPRKTQLFFSSGGHRWALQMFPTPARSIIIDILCPKGM